MSNPIPITVLLLEMPGVTAGQLTARYPVVEDDIGRRCLSRADAKQALDAHHARRQAAADQRAARAAEARRRPDPARERRRAIDARDAALLAGGGDITALECMMAGDTAQRLDAVGERNEKLRKGVSFGETYGKRGR